MKMEETYEVRALEAGKEVNIAQDLRKFCT
jgi:hypothetical protein